MCNRLPLTPRNTKIVNIHVMGLPAPDHMPVDTVGSKDGRCMSISHKNALGVRQRRLGDICYHILAEEQRPRKAHGERAPAQVDLVECSKHPAKHGGASQAHFVGFHRAQAKPASQLNSEAKAMKGILHVRVAEVHSHFVQDRSAFRPAGINAWRKLQLNSG